MIGGHYREDGVILAAWPSQNPFRHFILQHQYRYLDAVRSFHEFEQNGAADILGQIANDLQFSIEPVMQPSEIKFQYVHALYTYGFLTGFRPKLPV